MNMLYLINNQLLQQITNDIINEIEQIWNFNYSLKVNHLKMSKVEKE